MTYLDTHVVAWLYGGKRAKLSVSARRHIDADSDLRISPIVELELEYMFEIGRARSGAQEVLTRLEVELGLQVCRLPFPQVIRAAGEERWTRDPFDRIIVAQAKANGAGLVTSDERILRNYGLAVW